MEKHVIKYVLFSVVVAFFSVVPSSALTGADFTNASTTFECRCQNISNNTTPENQTTYQCNCETYLEKGGNKKLCFYDCSGENYTCNVNETCEKLYRCKDCHENATCKEINNTYGCVCDEGFIGDGKECNCGCEGLDCDKPKLNCSCENKTYCCSSNNTCPADCPNCKEEPCITNLTTAYFGNLTCWCNQTCGRVHGNYSSWSNWSNCSKLCGNGTQSRNRSCNNPPPLKGGRECEGPSNETQFCKDYDCPTIAFSEDNYTGIESDGDVKVVLNITSGTVVNNFNVSFSSGEANDTATKSVDYYLPVDVVFSPDSPRLKNISIKLVEDYLVEGKEHLTIMFSTTDEDVIYTSNKAKVTIEDSNNASVKFDKSHYLTTEKAKNVSVRVVLTGNITVPVTASLTSRSNLGNQDYKLENSNITFQPNASKVVIVSIYIEDETLVDNDENFSVILSSNSPMLIVGYPNVTVVTIKNDDVAVVKFESKNYTVFENEGNVTVSVILIGNITVPITIRLQIENMTAKLGEDFGHVNNTLTFKPRGELKFDINIPIKNDNVSEENETFKLNLSSTSQQNLVKLQDPNVTVVTIIDNDVNGNFSEWSEWSNCSKICGIGRQNRYRSCTSPPPQGEGENCNGNLTETRSCNITLFCPGTYNCTSMWSSWTSCNVTCGTGYKLRNRTWYNVVNRTSCNGTTIETIQCNMTACVNISYWSNWTQCNASCGYGFQTRQCLNKTGYGCNGTMSETKNCTLRACTEISNWSNWTSCNAVCGYGNQTRRCLNETGYGCNGTINETRNCSFGPCPEISNWSNWTSCSATCGDGVMRRQCLNGTGYGCNGKINETKNCTNVPCPVDGYFSSWSPWTKCSQTCGSGETSRDRTCVHPQHGGKNCSGLTFEEKVCTNPKLCPDEKGFNPWTEWGECSVQCLTGIQTRSRTCRDGAHNDTCNGAKTGNQTCYAGPCPVNGNWSGWGEWSTCPGFCGSSFVNRTRKCDDPPPEHGGANCTGPAVDVKECNHSQRCTGESGFTEWSSWTLCSVTCGNGVLLRTRECKTNVLISECAKESNQTKPCYPEDCPVNGGWSSWNAWSRCSSSCGSGVRVRKRTCTDPKPSKGGLDCYGGNSEEIVCVMPDACEDDFAYGAWGSWGPCNATCNNGVRKRERKCNIIPKYPPEGVLVCKSPSYDYQYISCYEEPCSIDGNFTNWSFWSLCSVTCGDGVRKRTRKCMNPPPSYGGADCTGKILDVKDCYTNKSCPDDKLYTPWSSWVNCSQGCEGITTRRRYCNATNDCQEGINNASKYCNTQLCDIHGMWSEWTQWSSCDPNQCGPQKEHRHRLCNNPAPQAAGNSCRGASEEKTTCTVDIKSCEKEIPPAGWTDWSWWKPCSKSCGGGVRSRHRKCSNPAPSPGGLNCTGNSSEAEPCNVYHCPVDGNFTKWTSWTNCTKECGNGTRTRNRTCTNPKPQYGGSDCVGYNFTRQFCNVDPCPIHGGLSSWSSYSFCSKPCNRGSSTRTRSCTEPTPKYGGRNCSCNNTEGIFSYDNCTDNLEDTRFCNDFDCPPVNVTAKITLTNYGEKYKLELESLIEETYKTAGHLAPNVGFNRCMRSTNSSYTCEISVYYNFSDGDQFPILRDILDKRPNISLQSMDSSVVFADEINVTAVALSSTSMMVNWSFDASHSDNITSIIVFYKIHDDRIPFSMHPVPASPEGGTVLKNLKKYTWYKITVCPTTINGTGLPSKFLTKKTLEDVPSKAPRIKVTSPNSKTLNVTWEPIDNKYLHGEHRGYCLWNNGENETLNETEKIIKSKPYTKHYIQIAARTTPGCGRKSKKKSFLTLQDAPGEPPQNVTAYNVSSTSLHVEWKEVKKTSRNGIILGYLIKYKKSNGKYLLKNITSPTKLHTVISGLSVWTEYSVSVAAYTKVGLGPSANVTVSTDEGTPTVSPVIVVAKNTSSTSINITWLNIGETGYGILLGYEITYKALDYNSARKVTKRLPKTAQTYELTELYYYWLYEITIGGYTRSGVGKLATRTVRTDEHLPGRSPENVRGVAETSTSIYVHWDEVASNFVHGKLLYYNLTVQQANDKSKSIHKAVKENEVPPYLNDLQKYTEYVIWVRAVNSKGHGKLNSPEGYRVRTKEDAPEAPPSNIRVTSMASISTLNLEWNRISLEKANGIIRGYYVEYKATILNGEHIAKKKQITKTFRVRGNRYATILSNLIPGSTYEIKMFGYTIKNGTKSERIIGKTCKCPEYLKVNWWNIPPYTDGNELDPGGIFSHTVNMLLDMCGTCPNGHGKTKPCYSPSCDQHSSRRRRAVDTYEQGSLQEALNNINDDVDISFPIQGNKYMTHYGGVYPYISVVETSGAVYFTVKIIPSTSHVIIKSAVYAIPLLMFITLLSVLAGIIIWLLERSSNPTSFPLSFTKGLKEGFWWAFISASTVGYGDRRPVTFPGKLFAILWIIVGYVIITLLTSYMVSSITLVLVKERTTIYGAKVAAIKNSTEYGKAIRQNGKVQPYNNVDEVIKALKDKVVDGAILDMYAAATRKDLFEDGDIQLNRQVEYPSGYGIVLSGKMKHSTHMITEYYKSKTSELVQLIQNKTDVVTQKQNQVKEAEKKKSGLFDETTDAYQLSLIVIFSLLAALLAGGLFWQYNYHGKAVKQRNSASGYPFYKQLREDLKPMCEDQCKTLIVNLKKLKEKHKKELKLLAKYYKTSGRPWPVVTRPFTQASSTGSFTRIKKMTASVSPAVKSRHNIALEVFDFDAEQEKQFSKDSQV